MRMILTAISLLIAGCGEHSRGGRPAECTPIYGFTGSKQILPDAPTDAVFAPNGEKVAVTVCKYPDPCNLFVVRFPSLAVEKIASNTYSVRWLDSDTILVATSPTSPYLGPWPWPYSLEEHQLSPTKSRVVATNVCYHRVSKDGRRLYVVTGCDKVTDSGALGLIERTASTPQPLATGIHAFSLTITPDGDRAAILTSLNPGRNECAFMTTGGTGTLEEIVGTKRATFGNNVVAGSLRYTSTGQHLFWRARTDPASLELDTLMVKSRMGTPIALGAGHFGFNCPEPSYAVSPDEKLVLGSNRSVSSPSLTLYAISTDGSGRKVLAGDLLNPFTRRHPEGVLLWRFSPSGRFVIYPTPERNSKALQVSNGTALTLDAYSVEVAPSRDEVAFIGDSDLGSLHSVSLSTGVSTELVLLKQGEVPGGLAFLPDGRGIVYTETHTTADSQIRYVSLATRQEDVIGPFGWQGLGYRLDPLGCSVVFSDWSSTQVAVLPY